MIAIMTINSSNDSNLRNGWNKIVMITRPVVCCCCCCCCWLAAVVVAVVVAIVVAVVVAVVVVAVGYCCCCCHPSTTRHILKALDKKRALVRTVVKC